MDWSLASGDDETAAGIAAALYAFWDLRGNYSEGRDWLHRVLSAERQLLPATRSKALMGAATLAVIQGDLEEAATSAQEAAGLSRRSGDGAGLSHALQYLGFVACLSGELERARSLLDDAERVGANSGARWETAWSHVFLSTLALFEDRLADAAEHGNHAELVIGVDGDQELLAWVCLIRGIAAWGDNRLPDAAQDMISGATRFQTLRGLWGISMALMGSGLTIASDGQAESAVRMFGAAEAVRASAGIAMMPYAAVWQEAALAQLRDLLAPATFATEWETGQTYTVDEAVQAAQSQLASLCDSRDRTDPHQSYPRVPENG
jgi:tetratricopeptide (TPR) repeat protein